MSKGYSCVKGIHFDQVQHSPDRITAPQKRVGDTWQTIGWGQVLAEIGARIRAGGVDAERIGRHMKGFAVLKDLAAHWTAERQAAVTGVSAAALRELVESHRKAAGGMLMGQGIVDMAGEVKRAGEVTLRHDREDGLPSVVGLQPSGMLAPDIEQGRVKAMIVEASNPLLACSNPGGRLDSAFASLELLVCIDLFRNEVGNLAHYILPAPTWLERAEIPYALQSFMACTPVPYMVYSEAVLEPPPEVRHEWWIYSRLAEACGVRMFGKRWLAALLGLNTRLAYAGKWLRRFALTPEKMIDGMLKKAGLPGAAVMAREHPHGVLMPENRGDNYLGTARVLTGDGLVDLAPAPCVETFKARVDALYTEELAQRDAFKLIGKREIKRMNTASANVPRLVKDSTNYAYLNPADAAELGVGEGETVAVRSAYGEIEIPVRLSPEMMPRTVAIPQCWGHRNADGLPHARRHPGVNSNYLAGDGPENIEALSGMSHLSGIRVELHKP